MCKRLVLALFVLSFCSVVHAQDAVKVDSKHYTVEFENADVRVLRIKYGPGEKSVMHQHPNSVAIFVTDATGKFSFPKDPVQEFKSKAGQVQWNTAVTHLPENTGDQPFEVILVELKSKSTAKKMAHKPSRAIAKR